MYGLHKKHKNTKDETGRDKLKGKKSSSKINGLFFNTRERGRKREGWGNNKIGASEREGIIMPTDRHQTEAHRQHLQEHRQEYK